MNKIPSTLVLVAVSSFVAAACASPQQSGGGTQAAGQTAERSAAGPAIIRPRTVTPILVMTPDLRLAKTPNIVAEIKPVDPTSKVSSANLQLVLDQTMVKGTSSESTLRQPLLVQMKPVAGTTWGASLTDDQLKKLAINGQEVNYIGRIIAKSDNGGTTVSEDIVRLTIAAPPVVEKSTG
ncbi:MAG: hypothetical protein P4M08_15045 [Oligoflexia bacterium]|nr:hypothetical protein [Oligoflexia bacterium]